MDREQFRKAGYAAIDRVCDYFENLKKMDVVPSVKPGDIMAQIAESAPQKGEAWDNIAADFDKVILPGITHWQHPNFMAYFQANTNYESILADIYAGAVSNPGFNWICSPSCTELEVVMMDWVAQMLGLDPSFYNKSDHGGGIIMGSASEAIVTVALAARERALRLAPGTPLDRLVALSSEHTHSSTQKAAKILGLKFRSIQTKAENDYALQGDELEAALKSAEAEGLVPFFVVGTVGSTGTGAVDDIAQITDVTAKWPNVFLHIDAAWLGTHFVLDEVRAEGQLAAINKRSSEGVVEGAICAPGEVHSFCTNLHKAGLVMFDASCLWVRDRLLLTSALDLSASYYKNAHSESGGVVDYRNWQMPLGRRFRSLKVYFVLRSYGVEGIQAYLRRTIALGEHFEGLVRAEPAKYELMTPRRAGLVVFRLKGGEGASEEETERLNSVYFEKLHDRRDVHLTPGKVGGKSCTRVAIGSPLTRQENVDNVWAIIREVEAWAREEVKK